MENTQSFLGNSSCKEKGQSHVQTWKTCQPYYETSPYKVMRKIWIHVHLYQEALLQADTLCSAHSHTQGEFHRTSNNWKMENSNTVALPCFNHNADATTHIETSRNVHNNGTLSTSLRTDTNMHANMDTNHIAHRHRHTGKEVYLLSGPSELQPTEDSETQKFNSAHVQQPRQEYSRFTETHKAKFQNPFIYNDDRNFVWHNSVDKFSPNLVFMTTPNTSVSNSVFCRKRGRKCGKCRNCRDAPAAEGPAPAPTAEGPVPVPAPAATLEIVHEQPHSKSKKVNREPWETSQCI